jgi:ribosomal protein S12 methylthiotransferase accessory factor
MDDKTIHVAFPGGVRVEAHYKGFVMATDQPSYAGGEGSAPSPFDLFLGSLAACAGYFVVAFCRERQISTEGLSLAMRMERNPKTRMISKVAIDISLPPGFPEKYKGAVIKAADQCTVKRHIAQPPAFEINAEIRT